MLKSVAMVFRKPLPLGQYSIESIFEYVYQSLGSQIAVKKIVLPFNGTKPLHLLSNMFFVRALKERVVHITGDTHYALLLAYKCKTILTIHDCTTLERTTGIKHHLLKWLWFSLPVKLANRVVAISEATAHDINKYTGYPIHKIQIIPSFTAKTFPYKERMLNDELTNVIVFSQSENKNLNRFIEAVKGLSVHLMIVGKLNEVQGKALAAYGISFENVSRATEDQLFDYYQRAQVLLFASIKEGFGMPIVEAQQQGLPVITSDCSSMPGVAGGGALLVDPFSVSSIRDGLIQLLSDDKLRNEIISKGRENAKLYAPEAISKVYLDLYRELLAS